MASTKKARSQKSQEQSSEAAIQGWKTTRELWHRASLAELDMERAGKPVTLPALWEEVKEFAPPEWQLQLDTPKEFKEALAHPGYRQLVDIRKRMLVIPVIQEVGMFKDLAGQAAYLAMSSAVEDLLLKPHSIPTATKNQLAKTFLDIHQRLSVTSPEESINRGSLEEIAAEETRMREAALANIPEQYRELMGEKWDEEKKRALRTRLAAHQAGLNEQMGHAKSS